MPTLKNIDKGGDVDGNGDINTEIMDHSNANVEIGKGRTLENIDACGDVCRDAMHCVSTAERVPPPLATTYATKYKYVLNWNEDKFYEGT